MATQRVNQLIDAGMWLQSAGDRDGARKLYEQALKLDPDNVRAKELLEGPGAPHSETGTRPPTIPASWNPFRGEPHRDPGPVTPSRSDPYREPPSSPALPVGDEGVAEAWSALPNKELSPDAVSAWDTKSNPGMLLDPERGDPLDALDLVSLTPMPSLPGSPLARMAAASREEVDKLIRRARDLQELDDHSGAMELITRAQELVPHEPEIKLLREKSERTLLAMYESKLGRLSHTPQVALKEDEIIWLNLDHRAGFILAQIDGQATFEDLFAISGMSRLDTARILAQLVEEGIIRR